MRSHTVLPEIGQSIFVHHHGSHSVRQGSQLGSNASTARPLLPVPAPGCSVLAWGSADIICTSMLTRETEISSNSGTRAI